MKSALIPRKSASPPKCQRALLNLCSVVFHIKFIGMNSNTARQEKSDQARFSCIVRYKAGTIEHAENEY